MVNRLRGQNVLRIQNRFMPVLDTIRRNHNIGVLQQAPTHIVSAETDFAQVVQNTDWYCWRGDSRPPYRYRRYSEVLERIALPDGDSRIAHVDIGCGAGLFSWAFLD